MAIDYGNFQTLNPSNLGYTSCPAFYAPLPQVLLNVKRIFVGKQAGAIAEIETLWGVELTALDANECKVGLDPAPVLPSFFVKGKDRTTGNGNLLEILYDVDAWLVVPEAKTESERTVDSGWYADLLKRVFWQADPRLYLWRAQFGDETDGDYLNFLTSIPPCRVVSEVTDITGQNSPFERCAVAYAKLAISSTVTNRR